MPVMELSKAAVKRQVLAEASKKTAGQINDKINELLGARARHLGKGLPADEIELQLVCWADIWLNRR